MVANKTPIPETQMELFKEIWKERPHYSQIILNEGEPEPIYFDPYCFAHVLAKGPYPRFKLLKQGIVLMTPAQHDLYDHRTDMARKLQPFDWVFLLRDVLVQLYYDVPLHDKLEGSKYWKNIEKLYELGKIE